MRSTNTEGSSTELRCDSLEPLLFVVERSGAVQTISPSVVRLCELTEPQILGLDLRSFLITLNGDWEALLPHAVADFLTQSVFLPWKRGPSSGLGWNVHAVPVNHGKNEPVSLSFVPGLAPEMSSRVPEEGLSQDLIGTLHDLYLRAQQSDVRFRRFLKLLPGISLIQNHELKLSWRGSELRMLLGGDAYEQLESVPWTDWIHPDDQKDFYNTVDRCKTGHYPVSSNLRLCLPNKRTVYLLDIRFPVIGLNGEVSSYEVLWIDLSRQRIAERRLHESAWKESLSEISGSLTHDFNNLMGGIINLSGLLRGEAGQQTVEVERSNIDLIWQSARQAQNLLQQVVSLNKTKPGQIELFDLRAFIEEQYDLVRIVLPQRIRLQTDLLDKELPVRLDKVALSRTILNFATNARDAIKGKGQARLSLQLVDLATYPREDIFSALCPRRGRAVELKFSDDGCGIPPQHINQIFCPYFSTKGEKSGSGLGLSSLYRYAEENGFDFGVRSKPGEGSEMLLLLPLDGDEAERSPAVEPEVPEPFIPAYDEELSIAIYSADINYAGFMEANFAQDYGAQARTSGTLQDVYDWLNRSQPEVGVLILCFERFAEIPEDLLACLKASFGKINRIVILGSEETQAHSEDPVKRAYFDDIFQSNQSPGADCQRVLRSFGHKSLFALQDFS
ncbi:MAG: ATP-binding protein [Opitutales bacterium]